MGTYVLSPLTTISPSKHLYIRNHTMLVHTHTTYWSSTSHCKTCHHTGQVLLLSMPLRRSTTATAVCTLSTATTTPFMLHSFHTACVVTQDWCAEETNPKTATRKCSYNDISGRLPIRSPTQGTHLPPSACGALLGFTTTAAHLR